MQLGPALHRIGNDIVAAYLIVQSEGITLVDAGLPACTPISAANWMPSAARSTTSAG